MLRGICNYLLLIIVCCLFSACVLRAPTPLAKVVDIQAQRANSTGSYQIQQGDTIYFIAWRLGMDYEALANYNQITEPYIIHVGQTLKIPNKQQMAQVETRTNKVTVPVTEPVDSLWRWPLASVKTYQRVANGINIPAAFATKVMAAKAGQVVYSGAGVRGYGHVVIIKHNQHEMSVYAFNQRNLVLEGQTVRAGQVIAEVGYADNQHTLLHFEIRRQGKSVDVLRYLPAVV